MFKSRAVKCAANTFISITKTIQRCGNSRGGGKPIGNISGNLASPPRSQFTYFDLIGPAYDSTTYVRTYREGRRDGARVSAGRLWHHVLRSYISKSLAAINVLAVLVRVGNQLKPPALVYSRIRRSSDSLSTLAFPLAVQVAPSRRKHFLITR